MCSLNFPDDSSQLRKDFSLELGFWGFGVQGLFSKSELYAVLMRKGTRV